ncbi:hypothetical protein BX666DRAFT_480771 [Dichotomocladium elegans]|nr:hypothetical protein BX666DRAFT_480771 [Dichotomocladium elegans]
MLACAPNSTRPCSAASYQHTITRISPKNLTFTTLMDVGLRVMCADSTPPTPKYNCLLVSQQRGSYLSMETMHPTRISRRGSYTISSTMHSPRIKEESFVHTGLCADNGISGMIFATVSVPHCFVRCHPTTLAHQPFSLCQIALSSCGRRVRLSSAQPNDSICYDGMGAHTERLRVSRALSIRHGLLPGIRSR